MPFKIHKPTQNFLKNPHTIRRSIDAQLRSQQVTEGHAFMPPWVPALDLVRPAAPNLTQIDPEPVGQFMAQSVQERRAGMSGKQRHHRNNNASLIKPHYTVKPPRIVYPEDAIRQEFYKSHPFELVSQPLNLVETQEGISTRDHGVWESKQSVERTLLDFKIDGQVRGESVVRYTYHLVSRKTNPLPQVDSYRKALLEFYQARREQEVQQDIETAEEIKRFQNEKAAASATAAILPENNTTVTTATTTTTTTTPTSTPSSSSSSLDNNTKTTTEKHSLSGFLSSKSSSPLSSTLASLTTAQPAPSPLAKFAAASNRPSHTELERMLKPKSSKFNEMEAKQIAKSTEFERQEMQKRTANQQRSRMLQQFDSKTT